MDARAACFERVQLIRDPSGRTGALNMALDEILLAASTDSVVLRLYAWSEPTVSFGYFESLVSAQRVARGRAVVRRWTGGGIVEHGDDVTYSLAIPRSCAFAGLRSAESYRRIHACIALALWKSGLHTEPSLADAAAPDSQRDNACFERPVLHDLLAHGKKVAGGAQRRSRVGLLHQGSVRIHAVNANAQDTWKQRMWHELPNALADICEERAISSDEIVQAVALAEAKYAAATWTGRF